jgi:CheY-like chemotaxis protein
VNRLVVVADGDVTRAGRLVSACQEAGIPAKPAVHGAQALELALSERPGLVVARLDLPLVDALRLAEILRANPRTRGARFLFLGDEDESAQRGGVGDVLLSRAESPEQILPTVEELIEKQDRIDILDAETEGDGEAEGELSQLPLAELLQLFHVNRKNGRLELRSEDVHGAPRTGRVVIHDGEVVLAQTGSVEGEKALFRMLGWRRGRFAFEPGRSVEAPKILAPTRALLMEGMRQVREWKRLSDQLPPLDAQVKLRVKSGDLPNIVHPLTQEVLLLLELYGTVGDVVDRCSFPDYQVLRTLHTLVGRDIVALGRPTTPRAIGPAQTASAQTGLFDEAQLRRLRDWIEKVAGRARAAGANAKLLVTGADPEAAPAFARLLQRVPGIRLSAGLTQGVLDPNRLEVVARIAIDDQLGIELLHVPVDARFAPLWALAAHGALGTLFLLGQHVGEGAERVRPMAERLQDLPHPRVFHVVLLGKDERISPDELRENLSLIDEASLFLLPIESAKEPAALLRSLFARVVP